MIFALVNVIGLCPVIAGGMSPAHSCCPHSTEKQIPCTESTARNCPYVLLEKAKSERWVAIAGLVAITMAVVAQVHPRRISSPIQPQYYLGTSHSNQLLQVLRI
jgi:hypothetical protein